MYRAHAPRSRRSALPRAFTTSTRASAPPARTSPTPPSRRPTTIDSRRRSSPRHRDRRRPVGFRARDGGADVRHRGSRLHGARELRAEAVSPLDDGDLGRRGDREPEHAIPTRAGNVLAHACRLSRLARHRNLRSGRGSGRAAKDTNYALGSVLNHVLLHQTVIGLEAKKQFAKVGDYPDVIIACCGGGSNFGGIAFPFFADKAAGQQGAPGRGRARVVPDADPRPLCLRFRRRRRPHAADADVHAGAQLRSAVEFMPAACATTAIRRWSRSFIMKGWSKRSRCRSARHSRPG